MATSGLYFTTEHEVFARELLSRPLDQQMMDFFKERMLLDARRHAEMMLMQSYEYQSMQFVRDQSAEIVVQNTKARVEKQQAKLQKLAQRSQRR